MSKSKEIVANLIKQAGIQVNGSNPWDIQVHNEAFYNRVLSHQALGLGESYMDGWWDCEAIDQLVDRVLRARLNERIKGNWQIVWHALRSKLFNLQKRSRAYQIAQRHYDIGNDLYQAMLDKRLNYSCAYWKDAKTLDEAQEAKLELICQKIELEKGMKVLDLGCGFGSFAKYAAEKYGAVVTGLNVSKEQIKLGRELCKGLPVEFILDDYRNATGKYDRIISIGFMEHVGWKNYRTHMEVVNRCLKDDGISFIHTIGCNVSATTANAWTTKYIFPNGLTPSLQQLSRAMEGLFVIEDVHNFAPDYDKTLMAWHGNFEKAWPDLKRKYDERFRRMWRYFLLSSAGGFRARDSQLWQIVMTKPGRSQPDCHIG